MVRSFEIKVLKKFIFFKLVLFKILNKRVPHFMTLHLRGFINDQANYPAVRMILKIGIYMVTHSQDRKGGLNET